MSTKTCTKCGLEKELTEFSPKGDGKFASRCKSCLAEIRRNNYTKQAPVVEGIEKQCIVCLETKPIDQFYKNYNTNNTHRNECKSCNKKRLDAHRKELKRVIIEIKSQPCMDCGKSYPYYVMDFDHRDGTEKENNISQMRHASIEKLMEEISKCDLVCSNCHRERTFKRMKEKEQSFQFLLFQLI